MRIPVFPQILYLIGCGIFLAQQLRSSLFGIAIWIPAISRNKKGPAMQAHFEYNNH
jgi:hypothetical protein